MQHARPSAAPDGPQSSRVRQPPAVQNMPEQRPAHSQIPSPSQSSWVGPQQWPAPSQDMSTPGPIVEQGRPAGAASATQPSRASQRSSVHGFASSMHTRTNVEVQMPEVH